MLMQVSAAVEQVSRHNTHEDSADSVAQALR